MMELRNSTAGIFVPDDTPVPDALARITHVGIGAHPDDLEFMAFHGIVAGFERRSFAGVTCTDGAGSPRIGPFAIFSDEQMRAERRREQNEAARLGRYGVMFHLDYPSAIVKDPQSTELRDDLRQILTATRPQVVYTHNPADKHDTHIGVMMATVRALRELPANLRPSKVYGGEIWRDLDWLPDEAKAVLDVSGHDELALRLYSVFASQIAGGKHYNLAVQGRRRANATFLESHATDKAEQVCFAMDLTPLVRDPALDVVEYVTGFVRQFEADVQRRLIQWK
jgi:LmbE family N-acetylglucosaminyl deacetylase